mmetsp:Transcript_7874/g.19299  ORF Transcript_7874/g.19299 Transcript_7874/m.19299 type:complete len:278 (-) Transcript_7874:460-1293(-)
MQQPGQLLRGFDGLPGDVPFHLVALRPVVVHQELVDHSTDPDHVLNIGLRETSGGPVPLLFGSLILGHNEPIPQLVERALHSRYEVRDVGCDQIGPAEGKEAVDNRQRWAGRVQVDRRDDMREQGEEGLQDRGPGDKLDRFEERKGLVLEVLHVLVLLPLRGEDVAKELQQHRPKLLAGQGRGTQSCDEVREERRERPVHPCEPDRGVHVVVVALLLPLPGPLRPLPRRQPGAGDGSGKHADVLPHLLPEYVDQQRNEGEDRGDAHGLRYALKGSEA